MSEILDIQQERARRNAPRKGLGWEPPPTDGNWLEELPQDTRFLAKLKHDSGSRLTEFYIIVKFQTICLLAENSNGRGMMDWRDTALFSQDYKFYCELQSDIKDGNGNLLLNKRMANNEEPSGGDQEP